MIIWKFPLEITDRQHIEMPANAVPLCVQMQRGALWMWALIPAEFPRAMRTFAVYGTGNPIPNEPGKYIGTVQQVPFVWHVFEVPQ